MAPGAVEMIAALGRLDEVVAVGDFVHWPPAVTGLPRIGAYDTPAIERILERGVTVLVTIGGEAGTGAHERLRLLGVEVLELHTETLAGTWEALRTLGRTLGETARAEQLVTSMQARLDSLAARVAGTARPRTLVVVGRDPLYVAGPGSHLDELVAVAGGWNVFADLRGAYALVSREAALERRPEVIIDLSDNTAGARRGRQLGEWAPWTFLPAVIHGRIYHLDPDRLTIPGPRLPEMAALLARIIHPELFGEPAPEEYGPLDDGRL